MSRGLSWIVAGSNISCWSHTPHVTEQVELIRAGVVPQTKVDGSLISDKHRLDVRLNSFP